MTPNDRIEERQQQIDVLMSYTAKHVAHLEALNRLAEKYSTRMDDHEAHFAALDKRLEALAANADRHDAELNILIAVATKHEARIDALVEARKWHEEFIRATEKLVAKNSEQIAELRTAIADLDRRWQAYINTLPRQ